ncbi:uncharacterized protein N7529_011627 [Penicillium soppii]|uniref:uncharacterized protein n=1 Tax=Penicillium soppii TaxID=69789 RepID=UPI0025499A84|nr:uncharacterized protein N7529_011627 [Penicillium soppii]KAJ5852242.1 hypothetical protein N7529_011627 [Penicillium soppii]
MGILLCGHIFPSILDTGFAYEGTEAQDGWQDAEPDLGGQMAIAAQRRKFGRREQKSTRRSAVPNRRVTSPNHGAKLISSPLVPCARSRWWFIRTDIVIASDRFIPPTNEDAVDLE